MEQQLWEEIKKISNGRYEIPRDEIEELLKKYDRTVWKVLFDKELLGYENGILYLSEEDSGSMFHVKHLTESYDKDSEEAPNSLPRMWRDKGNKLYVKGTQSNTWRVYYTDEDYEEIDEKEVEERYARNGENWYNVNWYDFKYQDFYYRYDNGKYTRKRVGYLIYEPIDRNKYLSAKAMSSL